MSDDIHAHRLKRLAMRSQRRGTREMDLILGPFADRVLPVLDSARLDLYEALLEENDHDLYAWIVARPADPGAGPTRFRPLLDQIAADARNRAAGSAPTP